MKTQQNSSQTKVTFSHAFGTPHRLCVCMPEASKKSLFDCTEEAITLSWSDDDLTTVPLGAWKSPRVEWWFDLRAEADGAPLSGVSWRRMDNRLPVLVYEWENENIAITLTATSCRDADVIEIRAVNRGLNTATAGVYGKMRNLAFNKLWMDFESPYNVLLPTQGDRSDRMLLLGIGADRPANLRSVQQPDSRMAARARRRANRHHRPPALRNHR